MRKVYLEKFSRPKNYKFLYIFQMIFVCAVMILLINFWSLFPYVYGLTTNLVIGLRLGLSYWLGLNLSNMFYKIKVFLGHFVSAGSPTVLGVLLTYVDLIRSTVRPITLSLRLVINISIGHVIFRLVGLVGSKGIFLGKVVMGVCFRVLLFFFIVERCVGVIQSMVFGLLQVKYLGEHR
jgi:F-type H+-transporting ATPase subunit a